MTLTYDPDHPVVEGQVVEVSPGADRDIAAIYARHPWIYLWAQALRGDGIEAPIARRRLGKAALRFCTQTAWQDLGRGGLAWIRAWWRWKTLATQTERAMASGRSMGTGEDKLQDRREKRTRMSWTLGVALVLTVLLASWLMPWLAPETWESWKRAGRWVAGVLVIAMWASGHRWRRPVGAAADYRPPGWDGTIDSLQRALRMAKVLTKDQHAWIAPGTAPEAIGVGIQLSVDLDGGVTWLDVLKKKVPVGSGLGVDSQFMMIEKGNHDGQATLWFTTTDPFAGGPERWPLLDCDRCNAWEAHPFGRTPSSQEIPLKLMYSNYLGGGLPGSGKSFTARVVAAPYILDPNTRVFCANGKGDGAWEAIRELCIRYIRGGRVDDGWAVAAMLDEVLEEMYERYEFTTDQGVSKIGPEHGFAPWLVIVDELQQYTTLSEITTETVWGKKNATLGLVITAKLVELGRLARASGIILVGLTQKPSDNALPSDLRDQFSTRYANRVGNHHTSTQVLGKSPADGVDASKLPTRYKGIGILVPDMEECPVAGYPVVRPYLIDDADWEGIGRRGTNLRRQAGTLGLLRGSMASAQPLPELLEAILELLEGVDDATRVAANDIREALAPDMTETAFGLQLRKWGCPSTQDAGKRGARGPFAGDVRTVVQRIRAGGPVELLQTA